MHTQHDRLAYVAKVLFGKQVAMAKAMGISAEQLSLYIRQNKNIGSLMFDKIQSAGVSSTWIKTGEGSMYADNEAGKKLQKENKFLQTTGMTASQAGNGVLAESSGIYAPLYEASAGYGTEWEETDLRVRLDKTYHNHMIGLRVRGESMIAIGILPDDIIIFDTTRTPRNGDIVAAIVGTTIVVKRLKKNGKEWLLAPENPEYSPIEIDDTVRIIGVYHELRRLKP